MRFWSKGLGSRGHIVVPCGTENVEVGKDGRELILSGKTLPPVVWNYTITMNADDFISILELGLSEHFVRFLLKPSRIKYAVKLFFLLLALLFRFIIQRPFDVSRGSEGGGKNSSGEV